MDFKKKIYLASDHAGFDLKEGVKKYLISKGFEVVDLGATTAAVPSSYASEGLLLGKSVAKEPSGMGFGFCGTGIGISIGANRVKGARAARVVSLEDAELAHRHNNANILTFGGRQQTLAQVTAMIDKFLQTAFEGGRHIARIQQLDQ